MATVREHPHADPHGPASRTVGAMPRTIMPLRTTRGHSAMASQQPQSHSRANAPDPFLRDSGCREQRCHDAVCCAPPHQPACCSVAAIEKQQQLPRAAQCHCCLVPCRHPTMPVTALVPVQEPLPPKATVRTRPAQGGRFVHGAAPTAAERRQRCSSQSCCSRHRWAALRPGRHRYSSCTAAAATLWQAPRDSRRGMECSSGFTRDGDDVRRRTFMYGRRGGPTCLPLCRGLSTAQHRAQARLAPFNHPRARLNTPPIQPVHRQVVHDGFPLGSQPTACDGVSNLLILPIHVAMRAA